MTDATAASNTSVHTPRRKIANVALVVRDYDEAIDFYVKTLGFELVEDSALPEAEKRWVLVRPAGAETAILLSRATKPEHEAVIGNQAAGAFS